MAIVSGGGSLVVAPAVVVSSAQRVSTAAGALSVAGAATVYAVCWLENPTPSSTWSDLEGGQWVPKT